MVSYSSHRDRKDIGPSHIPLTDEELDDHERLSRDYDKELYDNIFITYLCECLAFIVAHIPRRDPLRMAIAYQYKPLRLETPYFIDAWEYMVYNEARELTLVHLDIHAKSINVPYGGHYPDSKTTRNVETPLLRRRSDGVLHKRSRRCLRTRLEMIPVERIRRMAVISSIATTTKVNISGSPLQCSILVS